MGLYRRSPCFALLLVTFFTLVLTGSAIARQDPAPALAEQVQEQTPPINGFPSCDDPPLRTDADSSGCSTTGEAHVLDASGEFANYNHTGDPVALHNGMVSFRAVDLVIPGRCLDVELTRRYNSKLSDVNGPLGYGWSLGFDVWLELFGSADNGGANNVVLWNGNGRGDAYTYDDLLDVYVSPQGLFTQLTFANDVYTLRARHGSVTEFAVVTVSGNTYGRLISMESRNENALNFEYFATGTSLAGRSRLKKVIDSMGRAIQIGWSGGRVIQVTDFASREVNYAYDTNGNLASARSPAVLFASNDHLAPMGRIERYRYFGGTDVELAHLLTEIVRPNEGQAAPNGPSAVEFTYSTSGWRKGWCASQRLGDSASTVGGTINYVYAAMNYGSAIQNPATPRLKTSVTDRRGNVAEYWMNEYGNCVRIIEYLESSNQAVTDIVYDATLGLSEGLIREIIYPRGNRKVFDYDSSSSRWQQGNVETITLYPTPSESGSRSIQYVWDPIFNHLISVTDESGATTQFLSDWMEGGSDPQIASSYVLGSVAAELGITASEADTLVGSLLKNTDLNGDGVRPVVHGNIVQRIEPYTTLPSLGGGGQAVLEGDSTQIAVTTWTYNRYGQRTSMTDAEENVTVYHYFPMSDPDGDGVPSNGTHDTTTGGYLSRVIADTSLPVTLPYGIDSASDAEDQVISTRTVASDIGRQSGLSSTPVPTHKTTDFRYVKFGSVSAVIDPRGVRTNFHRNLVGEVYLIERAASVADVATRFGGADPTTAEVLTGQDYNYSELICHDFNGNVTERRVRNLGNDADTGFISGWVETYYEYDILDNLISEQNEASAEGEFAVTEYAYDENENLTQITLPEQNVVAHAYDKRNFVITTTRGAGSPDASTTARAYDVNGQLVSVKDGLNHETTFEYDGYGRRTKRIEPTGTETRIEYDVRSNVTKVERFGLNQGPSNGTPQTVLLDWTSTQYDERSRPWRVDRHGTSLSDGALELGNNKVTTRLDYDRLGRRTYLVEDDAEFYEVQYDGVHRPVVSVDPLRNKVSIVYDDNDNPIKFVETEVYPDTTTKLFETYRVFDSLNRLTSSTDHVGQTYRYAYDSRDNLIYTTDPNGDVLSTVINGRTVNEPGKARSFMHDPLDRLVSETLHGTEVPNSIHDGEVTLFSAWDFNNRLVSRTDDKGNVTSYEYDALGRRTAEELADNSRYVFEYGPDHTLSQVSDPNGSIVSFGYDVGARLTAVDVVQVGSYVVGTKKLRFEHDGLGRRTYLRDSVDDVLDSNDWIVTRSYDQLGRVLAENQGGRASSYHWTEESKRDQISYPSGLVLTNSFDPLDRVSSISQNGGTQVTYSYGGPNRVLERSNGNGTKVRYHDGAWDDSDYYDGARRPTRVDHVDASNALLTGFEHAYDRVGNRLFERRLHDSSKGDNYLYDSLYRLVTFERRVPAADVGTLAQGSEEELRTWKIDGVQNWRELVIDGVTKSTSVDAVNQYTAFGAEAPVHDANGNQLVVDEHATNAVELRYDFLNRLRRVSNGTAGGVITHDYDAEGRRVRTSASGVTGVPVVSEFVYDGWEEIEEYVKPNTNDSFVLARRYMYGQGLDEPVRLESISFYPNSGTYWYQQTTLGNVAAITNSSGAVVERYTYDAYGAPRFETASNVDKAITKSDFGNPYLFQSRRYDHGIYPLYDFRTRTMDPARGRFLQRDSIGTWGDPSSLGNALSAFGCAPSELVDPFGLASDGFFSELSDAWDRTTEVLGAAKDVAVELGGKAINAVAGAVGGGVSGSLTGAATGAIVAGWVSGGAAVKPGAVLGFSAGMVAGAINGAMAAWMLPGETSVLGPGGAVSTGSGAGAIGGSLGGLAAALPKPTLPSQWGSGSRSPSARTPVGRRGEPLEVPPGTNSGATINGRRYSGHAIDQMQSRGLMPSVIEDTINSGMQSAGFGGRQIFTTEQCKVILDWLGYVITAITR